MSYSLALPRLRIRRRRPLSPMGRVYLAFAIWCALIGVHQWMEIFAGDDLLLGTNGLDGLDLLAAAINPPAARLYWLWYKRERDRQ